MLISYYTPSSQFVKLHGNVPFYLPLQAFGYASKSSATEMVVPLYAART